ncbi:MAG: hypothetical protein ACM3MK_11655 [Chitinophagales bacterium]
MGNDVSAALSWGVNWGIAEASPEVIHRYIKPAVLIKRTKPPPILIAAVKLKVTKWILKR